MAFRVRVDRLFVVGMVACASLAQADLLVVNKGDDTLFRVEIESGTVVGSIETGPGPHEVEIGADGDIAVISNYGTEADPGTTLTLVKLSDWSVRTVDLSPQSRPHGIAFLSGGERLLVTTEGQNTLSVVNVRTGLLERAIPTGGDQPHMVVADAAGRVAWVTNIRSGNVSRIEVESGALTQTPETAAGSEGLALSPNGKQLWVTNRDDGSVSVHDPTTLAEIGRVPVSGMAIRVEIDPSGRAALVVSATSGKVTKIDTESFAVLGEVSVRWNGEVSTGRYLGGIFGFMPVPVGIQFTEKGDEFFVASSFGGVLVKVGLEELDIRQTLKAGTEPDGMAWLP